MGETAWWVLRGHGGMTGYRWMRCSRQVRLGDWLLPIGGDLFENWETVGDCLGP